MDTVSQKLTRAQATFAQRVLASTLVPADRLAAARAAVGDDADALGDYFIREGLLTSFQVRQIKAGASGFYVDKYLVLDCIGRGGTGIVFKARHSLPPNRVVALKTLDTQNLHGSEEAQSRFQREIAIITRLNHPNIVRAFEVIRTRTQIYLVLEYVDGQDLAALVKHRGALPIDQAVGYAIQAARGLSYAHRSGVIHRDLKPGNLLLTREGVVKLADLGLAREEDGDPDSGLTMQGACLGTPEFMAPEQAEDATRVDARTDLYGLGATLFHLLTGELPVQGSSFMQRLQRLLTEPPRPLAEVRPDVPAGLAALVDRLRARDPADRPASADEVIALLSPYARVGSSATTPLPWNGARKAALVLDVLQGKMTVERACAGNDLNPEEFAMWRDRFVEGGKRALNGEPGSPEKTLLEALRQKVANLARELDQLRDLLDTSSREERGKEDEGAL